MKRIVSGILFVLLSITMFSAALSVQPAKATAIDWWPMFHYDLNHTGTSTSTGPTTNNTLWNFKTGNHVSSSPAVVGGLVYVGSEDRNVYCLNASNGAQVWNYTTGGPVDSSPAVAGGFVYVGSDDNRTYCLNATNGTKVWNYTTGDHVWSSPAVFDGLVYVGSTDDSVYSLNATNGIQVWNYTTPNPVYSCPAVAGGLVYVGCYPDVYCLNATNRTQMWNYTTGVGHSTRMLSSPAVVGGLVYVGSDDSSVYCLNAANGAQAWNYTTGNSVDSSPAFAGGLVYVGSDDNNVYCMNGANGAQVWNYTTGGTVDSSPAVAGGFVYVGSDDNRTYCLNAATGAFVWSYTTGSSVNSSPAVANGVVYVGSEDGYVYAFGPPLTVSISPNSATLDAGQSHLFASTVSGGMSPYSYQWYLNGAIVPSATASSWTFTPDSSGSYDISVNVTDNAGVTVESNTASVTVYPVLSVSVSPTLATLNVNQSQLFASTVSGGTSPYSYRWYLNGSAVSGATNAIWTFTPTSAGSYTVYVNVTDGDGARAMSNTSAITASLTVPEFPLHLVLPLFAATTLSAAVLFKRKRKMNTLSN